ncbi:MAG: AarF/ABC1/UbiB kinase family protein [Hydrocarboniphaga sp.]|uniref:ABC1 kinase family protein n=1 Tax=Hydrocarboniphaga sp. TaxID=2033016 RepID=UPI002631C54A|nr:AarF/ABC1/UbiB kinase family protein [Hydrocarboniphaga sp.]MDB5971768.1 AarF/ABC1/UbiB kinase family protein [Hydrocarboniphaga sp.]
MSEHSDDSPQPLIRKPGMDRLKTRPFERNLALTKLGFGAGSSIVAHSIRNIFRGNISRDEANRGFYQKQAQILADELGQLKGSVMKAGQMLSLYGQYFLPEEAVEVLSTLQDDTPAVSWKYVKPVLDQQLGRDRLRELDIDEEPMAAASLGQAHRARRKRDGLELVVKIQYPGVADAIDSDIKTLSRLLLMSRLTPKGLDIGPIFAELREMLVQEVDYIAERKFTEDFARRLAGDQRFAVPQVVGEYCGSRVLTTSYESGCSIRAAAVQNLSQARRDRLGEAFIELFLTEFFDWGLVQTDPHFGNYRFRVDPDGEDRIVLIDFGATRRFERKFVKSYACIVRGAIEHDHALIERGAIEIGLIQAGFPKAAMQAFSEMCETIVEPFTDPAEGRIPAALLTPSGDYRWGESDLPMRAAQAGAKNALSVHFRVPPREIVFLHRRLAGVFIMLAHLRSEFSARQPLLDALPKLEKA